MNIRDRIYPGRTVLLEIMGEEAADGEAAVGGWKGTV